MQGGNKSQEQTEKQPTEQVAQNQASVSEKQETVQEKPEKSTTDAIAQNTEPEEKKVETKKPETTASKTASKQAKPKADATQKTNSKSFGTKTQSPKPQTTAKVKDKTKEITPDVGTKPPVTQPVQNTKPAETVSVSSGKIVFEKQGDVESVYLVGSSGQKYKSGVRVPVGDYAIKVKCSGKVSGAGKHTVKENKTTTYLCNCMMKTCSRK